MGLASQLRCPLDGLWLAVHPRCGGPRRSLPKSDAASCGLLVDPAHRLRVLGTDGYCADCREHRLLLGLLVAMAGLCAVWEAREPVTPVVDPRSTAARLAAYALTYADVAPTWPASRCVDCEAAISGGVNWCAACLEAHGEHGRAVRSAWAKRYLVAGTHGEVIRRGWATRRARAARGRVA